MGYRPMMYDPTLVGKDETPTVKDVVEFFDKVNAGQAEQPRNLAGYLSETEIAAFHSLFASSPNLTRRLLVREKILTLVSRQLMKEERFSEERARAFAELGAVKYPVPHINRDTQVIEFILHNAANLHFKVLTDMYVTSMELHQEDFSALFSSNGCIHDPDLVFARMQDPDFRVTDEQRAEHFSHNRDTAFNLMMSFGGYMVESEAINPKVKMMAMATVYRVLQGVFDPETLRQVDAQTELTDKVKKIAARR